MADAAAADADAAAAEADAAEEGSEGAGSSAAARRAARAAENAHPGREAATGRSYVLTTPRSRRLRRSCAEWAGQRMSTERALSGALECAEEHTRTAVEECRVRVLSSAGWETSVDVSSV